MIAGNRERTRESLELFSRTVSERLLARRVSRETMQRLTRANFVQIASDVPADFSVERFRSGTPIGLTFRNNLMTAHSDS